MRFHIFEISAHDYENGGPRHDDFGQPVFEAGENGPRLKICIKFHDIKSIAQIGRFEAIPVPNDPAVADNLIAPEGRGGGGGGAAGDLGVRPVAARRGAAPRQRQHRRYIIEQGIFSINTINGAYTVFGNFDDFANTLTQFKNQREIVE